VANSLLTINDVARLSKVSKKTVSRVINQSPEVKSETRARVESVIKKYGYEPDPQARGLAFRTSFLIGMIYNNPNPQYIVNMQQGILSALRPAGFELVIRPIESQSDHVVDQIESIVKRQKLAGVILPPSLSEDEQIIDLLNKAKCPYVRIASITLESSNKMLVTGDRSGAAQAAQLLGSLGHTRIAHISGPNHFRSSHERRAGFKEALEAQGLSLKADFDVVSDYTYYGGLKAAQQLLSRKVKPTAIFTGNDEMAVGVYNAARELGFSIPHDLSVIGYDDSPMAERLWPPLSSVRLPVYDMGQTAAEMLLAVIRKEKDAASRMHDTRLVQRNSTAKPAT